MTKANFAEDFQSQFDGFDTANPDFRPLPPIVNAQDLVENPPETPGELVCGVVHVGSKLVLGGSSKSFKTWTLLDLALSVQAGVPWWGFETVMTKVLYLNFEIQRAFITKRIKAVSDTKQIQDISKLDLWNLRGYSAPLFRLLPQLLTQIKKASYGLIILDPIYKTLGGRNENDAGDIGEFCNEIERMAVETGAAVAFGAHFAKGNASQKESIDRISGSGVFARDPDTILTLTKHEVEGAFTVDMTLRNFQPQESFCVRWEHPLMIRDGDLNPKDLKKAKGRPKRFEPSMLLDILSDKELTTAEWFARAEEEDGFTRTAFYDYKKELVEEKSVKKIRGKWVRCA